MTGAPAAAPLDPAALPAGARVEEYTIEHVLGAGGFGITYRAHDAHLDQAVALKEYFPGGLAARGPDGRVVPRPGGAPPDAFELGLQRFVEEARALATFQHPNIVRVRRYFRAQGTAYIVMDHECGLCLRRWLPQHQPLDRAALLAIVLPLLDGLKAVHAAGFLHRDIKPDNIHVRPDGAPVLLDFGAARRLMADGHMTNIVSPGFAPFEQYHGAGDQGPWTDLYALGAVMYWMVTGRRPIEAAARIQADALPTATAIADAEAFGLPLLRAIDWSLRPHERHRPQSVAELREALDPPSVPRPAPAASQAEPAAPASRRNLVCTILFLDMVGYSARSVEQQVSAKRRFNDLLGRAVAGVPEDERMLVDAGDGAAVCFLGDPEEALDSAMLLRDLVEQRYGSAMPLRMGLHMGPVRIVQDLNRQVNVIGDGINVAQRVMDFAQAHQILVSRAYHDVISRITDDRARMFRYLGPHQDKHGRIHELHALRPHAPVGLDVLGLGHTRTLPAGAARPLDARAVEAVEADLARHIGPLARVLVAKAQRRAGSVDALREALAPLMAAPADREAFLRGVPSRPQPARSRPTTPEPAEASRPSVSAPSGGLSSHPLPVSLPGAPPHLLAGLEQALGRQLGPVARVLVRQQAGAARDAEQLIENLAAQVAGGARRDAFRLAAQRLLAGSRQEP